MKHGGVYVRVNPCHLRHVSERKKDSVANDNEVQEQDETIEINDNGSVDRDNDETSVNDDNEDAQYYEESTVDMNSENDRNGEDQSANEVNEDDMIEDNNTVNQSLNDTEGEVNVSEHEARIEEVNESSYTNTEYGSLSLTVPKKGSRISYRLNDVKNLHKALVLGRAGKATGGK